MACITSLEQNLDQSWVGRATKTGESRKFQTLEDYDQYVKSLEDQGRYCAGVDRRYQPQYKPGGNTTPTGFMEFAPRDPAKQSKYSAMSGTWEGVKSSEAAIARGDYDLDMAEKNREDLRAKKPQPTWQNPSPVESSCGIQ